MNKSGQWTMHGGLFASNGLLLTPTIEHLFDRGVISFESGGELLISPVAQVAQLVCDLYTLARDEIKIAEGTTNKC